MRTYYINPEINAIADVDSIGGMVCWIRRINVPAPHRGKGYGSELLDRICTDADAEGMILMLYVVSTGRLDDCDLISWYERRGFIVQEDGFTLYRLPNTLLTHKNEKMSERGCKSSEYHGILTCK